MNQPHMNERQFLAMVKKQGFTIKYTTNGFLITSPDGQTGSRHHSIFKNSGAHSWANFVKRMEAIGVVFGEVSKEEKPRHKGEREAEILDFLMGNPGSSQKAIAEALNIGQPDVSMTVSRLENRGVVTRKREGRSMRVWPGSRVGIVTDGEQPEVVKIEAKMASNGKPSAGPVVVKQQEPEDPVLAVKWHAERLAEVFAAVLAENEKAVKERDEALAKLQTITDKLGSVIDNL